MGRFTRKKKRTSSKSRHKHKSTPRFARKWSEFQEFKIKRFGPHVVGVAGVPGYIGTVSGKLIKADDKSHADSLMLKVNFNDRKYRTLANVFAAVSGSTVVKAPSPERSGTPLVGKFVFDFFNAESDKRVGQMFGVVDESDAADTQVLITLNTETDVGKHMLDMENDPFWLERLTATADITWAAPVV